MIRIIIDLTEEAQNKLDIQIRGRPHPEGSTPGVLESQFAEKLTYKINQAVDDVIKETEGKSESITPFRLIMRKMPE